MSTISDIILIVLIIDKQIHAMLFIIRSFCDNIHPVDILFFYEIPSKDYFFF